MRNLLGRLNARPATDLDRIAAFWQVAPGRGDRHAQVGALYRAMIDPASARDAWERLTPDEAGLVRLMAGGEIESAATLREFPQRLGAGQPETREGAAGLYRHGILAREGDGAELPVGAEPRLFLPRELAIQFRRVLDEVDLGDTSSMALPTLIEWLDDGEIDDAATAWGVNVAPGARSRKELVRLLLRQASDPDRIARVARGLSKDAARILDAVRDEPAGAAPIGRVRTATGLEGDDARSGDRFRRALAELERSLLVWHTYRPDGSRWLFVPADIRNPAPPAAAPLPMLAPVPEDAVGEQPWRHPQAAAWDLLTLLRDLSNAPWPAEGEPPRARLRSLNQRLWHRGAELPPPGYLPFLIALAAAEGLVDGDDGPPPSLAVTAAVRQWRERSFPEQAERMRWWWGNSAEWIEGRDAGLVEIWGVDWREARRRLIALLGDPATGLTGGHWYTLESVTLRLAARDPELLGPAFTAATARQPGGSGGLADPAEARAAATAEAAAVELSTACAWLGLVEIADVPGQTRAVRVTALGEELARGGTPIEPDPEAAGAGPALRVGEDGSLALLRASSLRVWALGALAEPESLERESRYRMTEASVRRSLAAGFDLDQVTGCLERQSGLPVPPALAERLSGWARGFRRVRVRRAFLLAPDDPGEQDTLAAIAAGLGWTVERGEAGAVTAQPPADAADAEGDLLAALEAAGCSPVADGRIKSGRGRGGKPRER
ncbi:MAG: helicase-associated domain-containing protein [Chloroflexota bacterium]